MDIIKMIANSVELSEPVEIAAGFYWLGAMDPLSGFHYNHYLLTEGDQAVILCGGYSINIVDLLDKFSIFTPIKNITHAAFSGSVSQIGGTVAVMGEVIRAAGGKLMLLSHPRSSHKISFYYGVSQDCFYHVDQNDWKLTFNSGRTLRFIHAHNLSYPGSFMTYDERTGALFSGELFSGYPFGWSLYAQDYYLAAMEAYHYDHMPFGRLINCALDGLNGYDIRFIAPNHGSIINREIDKYMEAVRNIKKHPAISSRKAEALSERGNGNGTRSKERSFL